MLFLILEVTKGLWDKGNNKITELRTILQRESQNFGWKYQYVQVSYSSLSL